MKKVLKTIGIIFAALAVLLVVAYYAALKPRPLAAPKAVNDLSELETYAVNEVRLVGGLKPIFH